MMEEVLGEKKATEECEGEDNNQSSNRWTSGDADGDIKTAEEDRTENRDSGIYQCVVCCIRRQIKYTGSFGFSLFSFTLLAQHYA